MKENIDTNNGSFDYPLQEGEFVGQKTYKSESDTNTGIKSEGIDLDYGCVRVPGMFKAEALPKLPNTVLDAMQESFLNEFSSRSPVEERQ